MLGYSTGVPTLHSRFGSVPATFAMDNVQCLGTEASILDCPHLTEDNCDADEGAGVICKYRPKNNILTPISYFTWTK